MFDWIKKGLEAVTIREPYASSPSHRNAQRLNLGLEALESLNPTVIIPTKFMQSTVSFFSLFRANMHASEKIAHFIQGGISAAQMGVAINMLFTAATCGAMNESQLCNAALLLQLLYKGTLFAGWIPGEFSKDPYVDPAPANQQLLGV